VNQLFARANRERHAGRKREMSERGAEPAPTQALAGARGAAWVGCEEYDRQFSAARADHAVEMERTRPPSPSCMRAYIEANLVPLLNYWVHSRRPRYASIEKSLSSFLCASLVAAGLLRALAEIACDYLFAIPQTYVAATRLQRAEHLVMRVCLSEECDLGKRLSALADSLRPRRYGADPWSSLPVGGGWRRLEASHEDPPPAYPLVRGRDWSALLADWSALLAPAGATANSLGSSGAPGSGARGADGAPSRQADGELLDRLGHVVGQCVADPWNVRLGDDDGAAAARFLRRSWFPSVPCSFGQLFSLWTRNNLDPGCKLSFGSPPLPLLAEDLLWAARGRRNNLDPGCKLSFGSPPLPLLAEDLLWAARGRSNSPPHHHAWDGESAEELPLDGAGECGRGGGSTRIHAEPRARLDAGVEESSNPPPTVRDVPDGGVHGGARPRDTPESADRVESDPDVFEPDSR
jgi:hypothetical protein